jgi:hypothetical protein
MLTRWERGWDEFSESCLDISGIGAGFYCGPQSFVFEDRVPSTTEC